MAWTSSTVLIRPFIFSVAHRFIAGSTPANKESVVTWYRRMTAPTSSRFYRHFVSKMAHRILSCLLQSRPRPLSVRMASPCPDRGASRGEVLVLDRARTDSMALCAAESAKVGARLEEGSGGACACGRCNRNQSRCCNRRAPRLRCRRQRSSGLI